MQGDCQCNSARTKCDCGLYGPDQNLSHQGRRFDVYQDELTPKVLAKCLLPAAVVLLGLLAWWVAT